MAGTSVSQELRFREALLLREQFSAPKVFFTPRNHVQCGDTNIQRTPDAKLQLQQTAPPEFFSPIICRQKSLMINDSCEAFYYEEAGTAVVVRSSSPGSKTCVQTEV